MAVYKIQQCAKIVASLTPNHLHLFLLMHEKVSVWWRSKHNITITLTGIALFSPGRVAVNHDNKLLSGQTNKYQWMSNGPSANFSTTENFNFKLKLYHRCSRQICECCASVRVKSGQKSWDSPWWKSVIQWRTSTITNMTNVVIITTKAQTFRT